MEGKQGTSAEACAAMASELISLARQNRCLSLMIKMTLPQVMRTEKLTTTKVLHFIRNKINKLAGQTLEGYGEEIHRREYQYNALIRCPWALDILTASEHRSERSRTILLR